MFSPIFYAFLTVFARIYEAASFFPVVIIFSALGGHFLYKRYRDQTVSKAIKKIEDDVIQFNNSYGQYLSNSGVRNGTIDGLLTWIGNTIDEIEESLPKEERDKQPEYFEDLMKQYLDMIADKYPDLNIAFEPLPKVPRSAI